MKYDKTTFPRLKNVCSEFERRLVYRTMLTDTVKYRGSPTYNTLRLLRDLKDDKMTCLCSHCIYTNEKVVETLGCLQKWSGFNDICNTLPFGKTPNIQMWMLCCNFVELISDTHSSRSPRQSSTRPILVKVDDPPEMTERQDPDTIDYQSYQPDIQDIQVHLILKEHSYDSIDPNVECA